MIVVGIVKAGSALALLQSSGALGIPLAVKASAFGIGGVSAWKLRKKFEEKGPPKAKL